MDQAAPWLSQGDIFSSAPILDVVIDSGVATAAMPMGPAVLLTHDCAMDKAKRDGRPRAEFLQFAALRSLADALSTEQAGNLRRARDGVAPFDFLYIGPVGQLGESFLLLSDPYYLPMTYFDVMCREYEGQVAVDGSSELRAAAGQHDTRIGRLSADRVELLRRKMIAFWTRLDPGARATQL